MTELQNDGILDAFSNQIFPDDTEKSRGFRKVVIFILLPIFFILCFFSYYFIFVVSSWTAFASVGRAIFLGGIIVVVLLFSLEDIEWRLITVSVCTIALSIDIMAQIIGLYEGVTILGESLEYDFLAHAFGGLYITLIFTNLVPINDKKIFFVVLCSLIIAVLWEVFEFIISSFIEDFMNINIDQFDFVLLNSVSDLLAHSIGLGIAIFSYIAYKWIRCPIEFRSGIMCKI